jgi:cortexillin 1/2
MSERTKSVEEDIADKQWVEIQKTAFTYFVNSYLQKRGKHIKVSLEEDFSDGLTIIDFIELLVKKEIKQRYTKNPTQRIHRLENSTIALNFLKENGVTDKMLTISAANLVDKDLKLVLGFVWMMFRKFRIQAQGGDSKDPAEETLLKWVREMTQGYKGVNIVDFKTSFNDGLAFLALLHRFDSKLFDYDKLREENTALKNAEMAFEMAEKQLGVPKILKPEQLVEGKVDERSIILYVSLFFHAFLDAQEKRNLAARELEHKSKLADLQLNLDRLLEEKQALEKRFQDLTEQTKDLQAKYSELEERNKKLQEENEALEKDAAELRNKYNKLKEKNDEIMKARLKGLSGLRDHLAEHLKAMHSWKDYLEQDREYEAEKIQERTEKEIYDRAYDDQLEYMGEALQSEHNKLQNLAKLRVIEDQERQANAVPRAKKEAKNEPAKTPRDGDKKEEPKSPREKAEKKEPVKSPREKQGDKEAVKSSRSGGEKKKTDTKKK